jgi:hypothetical protein
MLIMSALPLLPVLPIAFLAVLYCGIRSYRPGRDRSLLALNGLWLLWPVVLSFGLTGAGAPDAIEYLFATGVAVLTIGASLVLPPMHLWQSLPNRGSRYAAFAYAGYFLFGVMGGVAWLALTSANNTGWAMMFAMWAIPLLPVLGVGLLVVLFCGIRGYLLNRRDRALLALNGLWLLGVAGGIYTNHIGDIPPRRHAGGVGARPRRIAGAAADAFAAVTRKG